MRSSFHGVFVALSLASTLQMLVAAAGDGPRETRVSDDVNCDGVLDLSDAIFTLNFLFFGLEQPLCPLADSTGHLAELASLKASGVACARSRSQGATPPELGIELVVENAAGAPGELVDLALSARADAALDLFRIVLELNPSVAVIESVDLQVVNTLTAMGRIEALPRDGFRIFSDCIDQDSDGQAEACALAMPVAANFKGTDAQHFLLDIHPGYPDYLGPGPRQVLTLRARIQSDSSHGETTLRIAKIPYQEDGFPEVVESGGTRKQDPTAGFDRIRSFSDGAITVLGFAPKSFRRCDSNADGKVDLSDAVATLGHLFLGNTAISCLDAADADDSGNVEITGAIFLLGALFLGTKPIPPPYPDCGLDPTTQDALGCGQGCG